MSKPAPKPKPKGVHWITGATVVTQDEQRRVLKSNLRIADGVITDITRKAPPRGARVTIASGLHIFPGLIQAHIHLCQTLFRNLADDMELLDWLSQKIWPFEAAHTAQTLTVSARAGIAELLSSGTTCLLDMGTVRHTESILKVARDMGIRGSFGKCLMDHPEHTPPELREETSEAFNEALALYRKWHGRENDRLRVSFAPRFVLSCTEKLLRQVAESSARDGILVHTHTSENRKEIEWVRKLTGQENIEYFGKLGLLSSRTVLAHGVWLSENERKLLAKTGTHIAHCPSSNLKLASGIAPIPDLLRRGISVALGADGAPCSNGLSALQEMRLAATLHKPGSGPTTLRAQEALDLATRGGARALGWQDAIGTIEVGKKADFAIFDLHTPFNFLSPDHALDPERVASSLVYSTTPEQLRQTWVDGKQLFDHAKPQKVGGVSMDQLRKDFARAQRAVLRSVR